MKTVQEWLTKKYPHKKGVKKIEFVEEERKNKEINTDGNLIITDFPDLEEINFAETSLRGLEVKNCPQLFFLNAEDNQLEKFSLVNCPWLAELKLNTNKLTNLDLTQDLFNLTTLFCFGNQLTALDISNNRKLTYLCCDDNLQPIRELINKIQVRQKSLTNISSSEKRTAEIELQELQELKERLEKEFQERESKLLTKINDLKIQLQNEKDKVADLESEYQELTKQLDTIKNELALTPSTPQPENQTIKQRISYFNNFLRKNRQESLDLRENIRKEQKKSQEMRNSLTSLANQLKNQQQNNSETEQLVKEKQNLQDQVSNLDKELTKKDKKLTKLEQENQELQAKINEQSQLNKPSIPYSTYYFWGIVITILLGATWIGYKRIRKS